MITFPDPAITIAGIRTELTPATIGTSSWRTFSSSEGIPPYCVKGLLL